MLQAEVTKVPILLGMDDLHVAAGSLCQADPPQCVADPGSFGIGDWSACNRMITHH